MADKLGITFDPYEALGLSFGVSAKDVKKAYRDLARKHHPDKASPADKAHAEAAFHKIKEASDYLLDEEKKEHYDKHIKARIEQDRKRAEKLSMASASRKRLINDLEAAESSINSKKSKNEYKQEYMHELLAYRESMEKYSESLRSRQTSWAPMEGPTFFACPDIDLKSQEDDILGDLL